jgi:hypothetical protein
MVLVSHREKEVTVVSVCTPIYFFAFHLYKQSSSDNHVTLEMEHAVTFLSPQLVAYTRASIYNHAFHLGSRIVTMTKIA